MPGLALGVPVVAARMPKFNVEGICHGDHPRGQGIRNIFFPPTALRMLKAADGQDRRVCARSRAAESRWAPRCWTGDARPLGLTINEFYGQTECNLVACSCQALFEPPKPGLHRARGAGARGGGADDGHGSRQTGRG